jgi:PAS domain S-box-containing protein
LISKATIIEDDQHPREQPFSEEHFRMLANSMPQLVWIADTQGKLTYFNERRRDYAGGSEANLVSEWQPMVHPDDLVATAAAWSLALAKQDIYEMEHRLQRADGQYRWHISRAFPMKKAGGEIQAWFGTATDIHRVKQSEAELHATEERLRLATQAADMFAWEVDLRSGAISWAANAADVIGCAPDLLTKAPRSGNFFVAVHERPRLLKEFNAALASGSPTFHLEFAGTPREGEAAYWRAVGKFLRNAKGEPERAVGVTQNVTAQRRADAALAVFSERLAAAEEGAGALVYDWDLKTGLVWRNGTLTRILGWQPDEVPQTSEGWESLLHPADRKRLAETPADYKLDPEGRVVNEYRVRHKDGHYVWVLDSGRVFRDAAGKIIRVAGTTIDISAKREAEASQRRTASLIELSFEPIFAWHPDDGILEWNKGAEQLYGFTRQEALGKRTHELLRTIHPCSLDELMKQLKNGKSWTGELIQTTRDGRRITVESRHQLIETAEDTFILETNRDIRERKRADAQVARLAAVATASHDALFGTGLDDLIEAWNPGAERLLGYKASEIIGRPHAMLALPENRQEQIATLAKVKAGSTVGPFDTQLLHKNGHSVHVSKAMTPVMAADGAVIGISIAAHDIGDRLEWEARQKLMNRELAHRVKNSFAILQAILRSTLKTSPDPAHFAQAFSGRLQSLSSAHDVLSANDWRGAEIGALLRHQLSIYLSGQRIVLNGGPVNLSAEHAAPVSLIVNELATNAVKYGALSVPTGLITITWNISRSETGERSLDFEWREQGGPPATEPSRRGFGTTLIQRSLAEAAVDVRYEKSGFICTLSWPLREISPKRRKAQFP